MKNNKAAIILVILMSVLGVAMAMSKLAPPSAPTEAEAAIEAPAAAETPVATADKKVDKAELSEALTSPLITDAPLATDFVKGNAKAPVTLIEYASLSCPHCAHFYVDVLPELEKKYISTGKMRYILRQFPLNESAMAGAMLTVCVGKESGADRYYTFNQVLFDAQKQWAFEANFKDSLKTFASVGGVSDKQFETCMNDVKIETEILETRKRATDELKVDSTPYIILNGVPFKGDQKPEVLSKQIDSLLADAKK